LPPVVWTFATTASHFPGSRLENVANNDESNGTPVQVSDDGSELKLEASRSKAVLWVLVGLVLVVGIGLAAISMVGGSVLYYKTPTEVLAQHSTDPVRLAGQLVTESVTSDPSGATVFKITDGKQAVTVVYRGGATTALTTASKPGTQMVAEGSLQADGTFAATNLLAKCPSKFQTASTPANSAA
jgi:cytochrome c-type biogenesis protein CcmE